MRRSLGRAGAGGLCGASSVVAGMYLPLLVLVVSCEGGVCDKLLLLLVLLHTEVFNELLCQKQRKDAAAVCIRVHELFQKHRKDCTLAQGRGKQLDGILRRVASMLLVLLLGSNQ